MKLHNWKQALGFALGLTLLTVCAGCGSQKTTSGSAAETAQMQEQAVETPAADALPQEGKEVTEDQGITIIYTNDIHSYIANTKMVDTSDPEKKEEQPALRLSKLTRMVKDLRNEGKQVLLVDAGDVVQGTTYGAIDQGESMIGIMNAAGYQVSAIGNHEVDYGMNQMYKLTDMADYPYLACNFHSLDPESTSEPFEAAKIFELGGKKVAFIGIMTPETITSSTPTYFQNEKGEFIYSIDGTADPKELYDRVQASIDEVRDEADYVIALGHLGVNMKAKKEHISSIDVIEHTTGLDAFIDGHSHTVMEGDWIPDQSGKAVLLTQTGSYLNFFGCMEIDPEGKITTRLIDDYAAADEEVAALEQELIDQVQDKLGRQIGTLDQELTVMNPDNPNQRLIRAQELNAGDFAADAFYWYFNEKKEMNCDIALMNGGGVRASVAAGNITLNDIKAMQPFGNMSCLIEASGQQIRDALEMGATVTGEWDNEWDAPAENGGFMQAAGMKYTIDAGVVSSVKLDEQGMFQSVDGEYRVKDIEVYNKETKTYEPLDLSRSYSVAGVDYILQNGGNGLSMFMGCEPIIGYVAQDSDVVCEYVENFLKEGELAKVNTKNSPLSAYDGYQIDYENPLGAGRIQIIIP